MLALSGHETRLLIRPMKNLLALITGSIAGGLARYYMSGAVFRITASRFPFGTLAVNLTGCFIIVFITALGAEKFSLSHSAKLLLVTGFCGAFTTFSAFILETDSLIRSGNVFWALLYILVSVCAGFLLFRLGVLAGEII